MRGINSFGINYAKSKPSPTVIDFLLIAGGGSGGYAGGGGGGAGGYRKFTNESITPGTYNIVIGSSDSDSTFKGYTSQKGGRGGDIDAPGYPGGSGGGGGGGGPSGGDGNSPGTTPSQGNPGASAGPGSAEENYWAAGGGGGSASAGSYGSDPGGVRTGGFGGQPTGDSITGTLTYRAGGGGGSFGTNGPPASGGGVTGPSSPNDGRGYGGSGGYYIIPPAGFNPVYGSPGSAGVLIISMSDSTSAQAVTGSPTITFAGGKKIYYFGSSGSITF